MIASSPWCSIGELFSQGERSVGGFVDDVVVDVRFCIWISCHIGSKTPTIDAAPALQSPAQVGLDFMQKESKCRPAALSAHKQFSVGYRKGILETTAAEGVWRRPSVLRRTCDQTGKRKEDPERSMVGNLPFERDMF